jgi:hypothetical protein
MLCDRVAHPSVFSEQPALSEAEGVGIDAAHTTGLTQTIVKATTGHHEPKFR